MFNDYQNDINALVNRRNAIAHGNFKSGVTEQEFTNWESKAEDVMSGIMRIIYDYAKNRKYLNTIEWVWLWLYSEDIKK